MLIRLGYDIQFELASPAAMIALLTIHPRRQADLRKPDQIRMTPEIPVEQYTDAFGNLSTRFLAPSGRLRLHNDTVIEDSGLPDSYDFTGQQSPIEKLPVDVLTFLLPSRYCQVDQFVAPANDLFGGYEQGWPLARAICDWVHRSVTFGYQFARPTKTALDVFTERTGVCRDFQHLAITFTRAMNIPARYMAGYLTDIGITRQASPMDFSAWYEVYLGDRWWPLDARFNEPRVGRIPIALGRDAADTAITTCFGKADLRSFAVIAERAAEA